MPLVARGRLVAQISRRCRGQLVDLRTEVASREFGSSRSRQWQASSRSRQWQASSRSRQASSRSRQWQASSRQWQWQAFSRSSLTR